MRLEDMRIGMEVRGPQGHAIVRQITDHDTLPIMVEYDGVAQWGEPDRYETIAPMVAITPDMIEALDWAVCDATWPADSAMLDLREALIELLNKARGEKVRPLCGESND